ncbi:type VI-A CRISPR-associated RNA-guided ribonuclease Cas13a [uncultured Bacteroides sp.]|uniref:type VI-A CRISPR-associated RNA-guided ribonuclease Cas13a n=1 Tax=uncultured Bacteroides sp. TaxID=162156 RepID=UPI002AAB64CE|nr:type VI-A CRISPR-associated RNA-guided ribonuclease Cas13a [uncultured Bacteroides sp.]
MRVSKVKVSIEINRKRENRMVLMKRTSKEGSLVYDDKTGKVGGENRTNDILPEKKKDSFELSIQNQTIPKLEIIKKHFGKSFNKNIYDSLSAIIKGACTGKYVNVNNYNTLEKTTEEQIKAYLNHRFQGEEFKYIHDGNEIKFKLAHLLIESIKQKNINPMEPYRKWAKWYINNKSTKLIKSIQNDHITIDDDNVEIKENYLSPRKRALLMWEDEFIEHSAKPELIHLYNMHTLYQIDRLMEQLRSVEYTIGEKGISKVNEYHRTLKKILQNHQQNIFGSRDNPCEENRRNVQLYTYNMEVVKYLEHYFPIKWSKRKTSVESINYYLSTNVIKDIIRKQLENAVRSNLIRQGKYAHHDLKADTVSSSSLSEIKADEGFSLNMITQCAFAANNIRNIIDPQQTEDIIGKNAFIKSLSPDYRISQEEVFPFFFDLSKIKDEISDKDYIIYLWAIRGAVQQIRNNVVHYKKNSLDVIFNIKKFELEKKEDYKSYKNDTLFGTLLQKEKEEAPKALAWQLMTGSVLEYYPMEKLKFFFADKTFSLYRSSVAFAPGFKNVMKGGSNYQNAGRDQFYNLKVDFYLPKESFNEEAWNARYFFLKLIYNNLFLPIFTKNAYLFRKTINEVLQINDTENQKQARYEGQKIYNRAFANIRRMKEDESISSYTAYLQSYSMMEASKKAENDGKEESRLNFEKFLLQTFIKGFNDYLNLDKSFVFIQHPTMQFDHEEANKANKRKEWVDEIETVLKLSASDIDSTNNAHISFFIFCKLLDAVHLSDLRNELTKYYQSQSYRSKETQKIKHLFAIIELCLLSVDAYSIKQQITKIYIQGNNKLAPFLEDEKDLVDYGNLYTQSDDKTIVIHRAIEKSYKYGTRKVLQGIINSSQQYRITTREYEEWNEKKQMIEDLTKKREELHNEWEEYEHNKKNDRRRIRNDQKDKSLFATAKAIEYEELCNKIDRYNWLDNKLHLQHVNRLHNLTMDILGRMAGFTSIFERDLQYYCNNNSKMRALLQADSQSLFDFSRSLPQFTSEQNSILFNTMLSADYRNIRNYIAHFNFLNAFEEKRVKSPQSYSLIELINGLRNLFSYDRKLKNAVSKAFIKIFEKHGMILKLETTSESHRLKVASISPRQIKHLGNYKIEKKSIQTDMVEKSFCNMCISLLELKNE